MVRPAAPVRLFQAVVDRATLDTRLHVVERRLDEQDNILASLHASIQRLVARWDCPPPPPLRLQTTASDDLAIVQHSHVPKPASTETNNGPQELFSLLLPTPRDPPSPVADEPDAQRHRTSEQASSLFLAAHLRTAQPTSFSAPTTSLDLPLTSLFHANTSSAAHHYFGVPPAPNPTLEAELSVVRQDWHPFHSRTSIDRLGSSQPSLQRPVPRSLPVVVRV